MLLTFYSLKGNKVPVPFLTYLLAIKDKNKPSYMIELKIKRRNDKAKAISRVNNCKEFELLVRQLGKGVMA